MCIAVCLGEVYPLRTPSSIRQVDQLRSFDSRRHRIANQQRTVFWYPYNLHDTIRRFFDNLQRALARVQNHRNDSQEIREQARRRIENTKELMRLLQARQNAGVVNHEALARAGKERAEMLARQQEFMMENLRSRRR